MKAIRIIYRGHLLPPFVTPFTSTKNYLQIMHPAYYENISGLSPLLLKSELDKRAEEYYRMNNSIKAQIAHFRVTYILPLRTVPFFYEELHRTVLKENQILKFATYEEAEAAVLKTVVYKQFIKQYYAFKQRLSENEKNMMKELRRIPPCIYFSPQQMARDHLEPWQTLTPLARNAYEKRFLVYLEIHQKRLETIAAESGLLIGELLQLMRDQFTHSRIPLSTANILFPS